MMTLLKSFGVIKTSVSVIRYFTFDCSANFCFSFLYVAIHPIHSGNEESNVEIFLTTKSSTSCDTLITYSLIYSIMSDS